MANKYRARIKSKIWGNKTFTLTNTFRQHLNRGSKTPGIDFGMRVGTPLYSKWPGVVYHSYTEPHPMWKKNQVITIKHKGFFSQYTHLSKRLVKKGQKIKVGKKIALSGKSGIGTGPHLHFAILPGGSYNIAKRVDPYKWVVEKPKPKPKDPCVKWKSLLKSEREQLGDERRVVQARNLELRRAVEKASNLTHLRRLDTEIINVLRKDKRSLNGILGDLQRDYNVVLQKNKELTEENVLLRKRWVEEINWKLLMELIAQKLREVFKRG